MNETWWLDPNQLDDAQKQILLENPETQLLIVGPPGSGKTNLLILRANYVRSVASRILLLTFTRTLNEFLKSGPNIGRGDQIREDEIKTFMGWAKQLLRDHGGEIPEPARDFEADRLAVAEAVVEMIDTQSLGKLYDVIFVDEVQDLLEIELRIIRRLAHRINAAGDSRQRIWRHREGLPTVQALVDRTVALEQHYRIGVKICDFADQILPPKLGDPSLSEGCNYDEEARPSSVFAIPSVDLDAQIDECIDQLKEQRRYITDEPIGVLTISGEARDKFWDRLVERGELVNISVRQRQEEYQAFGPDSLIRVMTVASAKGSEFRAVHLIGAEDYGTNRRELAFTAVTRAKTEVILHHSKSLKGHMKPAGEKLPSIDDLF
ncbi:MULTISPECIES: UvrD-helicase domain-containing protein [unclassified Bradyrhizobium]|uniref:UvrD-helicase domain-containing protein n=1 Tax=unclassified Bradyrhizobium TaxID=2631580 RepID=UPI001BA4667F|nr:MULTISPECIES: UvrD-helicase domain-containing protein [unclassified Bradyrhizobium]MBR1203306.1 ATP-dependent helicase [Bradyrhizobium sp. AUGA SZCCT0124]MBR1312969.1 ATP-dependent helicase [Bradyrhizobium sp. AUGA SZCCT0051]MBR1341327.1 ATP-dependent helicase [Bradyrhizobium sp. AUGA SZCCT0105]MBR1356735.1 ATP-dependent helicase [Bradyrhizobium sp. AUGA SZCCT0045]